MFRELETLQPSKIQEIIDTYGTRTYRWYRYYYQANAPMHNADVSFQGGAKKWGTSSPLVITMPKGYDLLVAMSDTISGQM